MVATALPSPPILQDMLSAPSSTSSLYVSLLAVAQVATADDFGTFIFVSFFFFPSHKSLIGVSFVLLSCGHLSPGCK